MDRDAASRARAKRLEAVHLAGQQGRWARVKRLSRKHLTSEVVRLDAAYRTLGVGAAYDQAAELAARVSPFEPCHDIVRWWRMTNRNGGTRPVCSLPATLKTASHMIKDLVQAMLHPGPHLYDIRGRGRDVEAFAIKAALEQGYEHCLVGDLRNCFQSVQVEALYTLPLPASVVRYVLDYRNLTFQHDPGMEELVLPPLDPLSDTIVYVHLPGRCGPRGLLQGSPASNAILAWLLNDLPSVFPQDCVPFLLSDNVVGLARTEQICRRIEETLTRYFAGHRAGPFVLEAQTMTIDQGFETAGYHYRRTALSDITLEPSWRNEQRMWKAVFAALEEDRGAGRVEPTLGMQALRRRLSGFRAMDGWATLPSAMAEWMSTEISENGWSDDADEPSGQGHGDGSR